MTNATPTDQKVIRVDVSIEPKLADPLGFLYMEIIPIKIMATSVRHTVRAVFSGNRSICFTFTTSRNRGHFQLVAKAFAIMASRETNHKIKLVEKLSEQEN